MYKCTNASRYTLISYTTEGGNDDNEMTLKMGRKTIIS